MPIKDGKLICDSCGEAIEIDVESAELLRLVEEGHLLVDNVQCGYCRPEESSDEDYEYNKTLVRLRAAYRRGELS